MAAALTAVFLLWATVNINRFRKWGKMAVEEASGKEEEEEDGD